MDQNLLVRDSGSDVWGQEGLQLEVGLMAVRIIMPKFPSVKTVQHQAYLEQEAQRQQHQPDRRQKEEIGDSLLGLQKPE